MLTDEIEIGVAPEAAFAAVSDLAAMGRRSIENTGGAWLDGVTGPALGARFRGTNERDGDAWATVATVVGYDPPRRFAFEVDYEGEPVSWWEYEIEATATGCRVTERTLDRRGPALRAEDEETGFDRAEYTVRSLRATLEALKEELEARS
jgi:hypothetical protein